MPQTSQKTSHKIIIGDSRRMDAVADNSAHLVITSPPYWQLKDYEKESQIGFGDSYEEYINNLNLVWMESYRILNEGCRLCINIGDQFARSVYYGRYKVIPIRTEIIRFCETIGFDYMGAIIWQKITTTNTTGGATIMGSYPYPRNGILKIDYEFILIFKKQGKGPSVENKRKEESKLTKKEWNEYFSGHWNFPGEKQKKHLSMFPVELPTRLIKMFTFTGETVLDPFTGSGTTNLSAVNLARNSIGYDINENYLPVIEKKLDINNPRLFPQIDFIIERQKGPKLNLKKELKKLPYVFKDPVKMDKKLDPKRHQYGSKIDSKEAITIEYYNVKKVIGPNLLELNNGVRIRLIGIKPKKETGDKAVQFLKDKTKGQRVFLKSDNKVYDKDKNLLCYLYLKNKTFINAHLAKSGLVAVDKRTKYRYKEKFLKYGESK